MDTTKIVLTTLIRAWRWTTSSRRARRRPLTPQGRPSEALQEPSQPDQRLQWAVKPSSHRSKMRGTCPRVRAISWLLCSTTSRSRWLSRTLSALRRPSKPVEIASLSLGMRESSERTTLMGRTRDREAEGDDPRSAHISKWNRSDSEAMSWCSKCSKWPIYLILRSRYQIKIMFRSHCRYGISWPRWPERPNKNFKMFRISGLRALTSNIEQTSEVARNTRCTSKRLRVSWSSKTSKNLCKT